jgi:hypothetical protein
MDFKSKFGDGNIDIESTGNPLKLLNGFKNMAEQVHILTHPIIGYYDLKNGEIKEWSPFPLFPLYGRIVGSLRRPSPLVVHETRELDGWVEVRLSTA